MQVLTNKTRGVEKVGAVAGEGLAAWALRVFRRWRNSTIAEPRQMRVVETLALGGRRQLTLVVCGTERFLVGVSAESVNAIVRVHSDDCADPVLRTTPDGCV
jgi:flagellar biogenesis protein FliO